MILSGQMESDEIIYDRFLEERKEEDFRILLERHKDRLVLFLNGYVHNLADAEELMLDAFAEVALGRSIFAGRSSFRTWLYSIGKKLALSHLRKTGRRMEVGEEAAEGVEGTVLAPDVTLLQEEGKKELYQALESLNSEYRQVLMLLYFEEMSHEEVARVMRKSMKQIYNLTERGKKALREVLERMGFDHVN